MPALRPRSWRPMVAVAIEAEAEENAESPFAQLPDELVLRILLHDTLTSPRDRSTLPQVCRRFWRITRDCTLFGFAAPPAYIVGLMSLLKSQRLHYRAMQLARDPFVVVRTPDNRGVAFVAIPCMLLLLQDP